MCINKKMVRICYGPFFKKRKQQILLFSSSNLLFVSPPIRGGKLVPQGGIKGGTAPSLI
ncbi:MAG: hypothetical protein ACD_80C00072G0005, partial [uncultured bacterium (gcode 4)]